MLERIRLSGKVTEVIKCSEAGFGRKKERDANPPEIASLVVYTGGTGV
jgi:hypothetical protein